MEKWPSKFVQFSFFFKSSHRAIATRIVFLFFFFLKNEFFNSYNEGNFKI
jgi:hypothetical protein